ncbi:MAG: hypothetical protein EZS28_048947 [Streblomastix strix]|uniref:Uncharacterized protein n=1 Tax=Streblomastix strix TaxID=222440 RepID=A0A5J4TDI0_9EUKA|nr:MAG: hypothetical protein EZS28_048947 [Streblomastix strix]
MSSNLGSSWIMAQEHVSSRIASLDDLQRCYRFLARRRRVQLQVLRIQTWIVTHNRKRSANEQKGPCLSRRAAQVVQGPLDITGHIQEGASAGDTVFLLRIQADLLALGHHEEIDTITDITTINATTEMTNFGEKWAKQQEYIGLPSLTRTRQNLESFGGGKQNKTGGDTRICGPLRNQLKYNQMKCHTHMLTAPEQFHLRRAR